MLGRMRSTIILALLAVSLVASARPAPAQAPGPAQAASFRVFLRGTQVGTEDSSLQRTPDGWLISGTGTLAPPVGLTIRRAEIRYSETWQARSLVLQGQFRDRAIDVETTFDGGQAKNRFVQDGATTDKTDPVSADAVVLPNNFYGSYAALAVRLADVQPGGEVKAYVAPQGEIGIVLNGVETVRVQTPRRTIELRKFKLGFKNPGGTLDGELWAEPDGRLVRISIPTASLDVVRDDVASVSARQENFRRDGDEDVRIPAVGFTLAGTVSKPKGGAPAPNASPAAPVKLPAIVLVAGSGQIDRDEVVAGIPIFGQLASALADAGYLVVRYDKRGVGQSGGRPESATIQDYADDVLAVVKFLRERKDVDEKRIAIAGHSEGAWSGMLAASRDDKIWRVILLGGAGIPGAEVVLEQQKWLLDHTDVPAAEREEKIALQKKIQQAVLTGTGWDGIDPKLRKQAETPWFASFLAFTPKSVMAKVRQPVLIIQGELDRQVFAHNADELAALARARKKDPGEEVVRIPGVNHLFVPAETGDVTEYGSLKSREISPKVAEAIVAWLGKAGPGV
jgi:hypothetical protein